jgi:glucokinase
MSEFTLAIDIGGTKIAVGLVDPDGTLTHSARHPTSPPLDATGPVGGHGTEAVWDVVDRLVLDALTVARGMVRGVGIASAGPVDLRAGTVSPLNISAWRGFPLRDRVAAALPGLPVRLGGDGLCMALGEHWRGAGRGADFLLGMVVSTGVGGGLVLDGAPYDGRTGNAGHVGHVVVDLDGGPCSCGGHGCVETIASGPNMVTWALSHGWPGSPTTDTGDPTDIGGRSDGPPDARQLAADADAGHPVAREAFRRGATAVAAMIASVAATCDLDRVVIGGGVSRSGPTLFDPLGVALTRHARLGYLHDLRVVPATLPDAGLIGAAALVSRSWC